MSTREQILETLETICYKDVMSEYRFSQDLPTPTYPSTDFVDAVTADMNPVACDLVRATYLTHYFGQGHQGLTQSFAETAAPLEIFYQLEDRKSYPEVRREVASFFNAGGSAKIANVAPGHYKVVDQTAVGDKTQAIQTTWDTLNRALPSYEEVCAMPSFLDYAKESRQKEQESLSWNPFEAFPQVGEEFKKQFKRVSECRPLVATGSLFLEVDAECMRAGRQPSTYEGVDQYTSFTREAVLHRPNQVTTSAAFNLIFTGFQIGLLKGFHKREMRELKSVWKDHHAERFVPEIFNRQRSLGRTIDGLMDKALLSLSSKRGS